MAWCADNRHAPLVFTSANWNAPRLIFDFLDQRPCTAWPNFSIGSRNDSRLQTRYVILIMVRLCRLLKLARRLGFGAVHISFITLFLWSLAPSHGANLSDPE